MPINREDYPPDWADISRKVRQDAGQTCEALLDAEGKPYALLTSGRNVLDGAGVQTPLNRRPLRRCNAPNRTKVQRKRSAPWVWRLETAREDGSFREAKEIVLTAAHINHTPSDPRPAVLRAFCQRCHLVFDSHHRARKAARTRQLKAEEGQGQLWGER